ncbi:hypothetical protein ACS0TY_016571 [Phlomoides rotata]
MDPNNSSYFGNSQDYPNFGSYLNSSFSDSEDFSNLQFYQNSQFSPDLNQVPISEQVQTSQNITQNLFQETPPTNKNQRDTKNISWCVKEDVALMSAWCYVSGDSARVYNIYHENRQENPGEISERNVKSMKGRWKQLSENANKWIVAYKEAYRRKRSVMSQNVFEKEALSIY